MLELLKYIIEGITGSKDDYLIDQKEEEGKIFFEVKIDPKVIGIVIGKQGRTIKSIQEIVRLRGKLENKAVFISISEKIN